MQLLQEKTKMTFEDKLKKLEELTETVKNPETSLEDALKAFEEGIKTARTLEKEIETIEDADEPEALESHGGIAW